MTRKGDLAPDGLPSKADAFAIAAVALGAHLGVAVWAAQQFPPAFDGTFYDTVARRIADGLGYTWLWPDGSVTFAAHYPIGYPALLGVAYALVAPLPATAMLVHALLAAVGTFAAHRLAARVASRPGALFGAALAGLHPGLLAYTPALMTEAVVGSVLVVLVWLVVSLGESRPRLAIAVGGIGLGLGCLMRPQLVLLAPALGLWLRVGQGSARNAPLGRHDLGRSIAVLAMALAVAAPWTLRNCAHMGRCVWISTNAGWNLLIGTSDAAKGAWMPLDQIGVPEKCRTVFNEAEKDRCFEEAALGRIAADVGPWLALVPRKLGITFNGGSPGGSYLHASNPAVVSALSKQRFGALDTLWQRAALAAALVALARTRGSRQGVRQGLVTLGLGLLFTPWAWLAVVALLLSGLSLGWALSTHPPAYFCVWVLGATLLTHAVFFGAGRYALVTVYMVAALGGAAFPRQGSDSRGAAIFGQVRRVFDSLRPTRP